MNKPLKPLGRVNDYPVYGVWQCGFDLNSITEDALIIDGEGWKQFQKNELLESLTPLDELHGLAILDDAIELKAVKIPYSLIKRVTAFFRTVFNKSKTEAVGYLYYNTITKEWDFIPPIQSPTPGSVKFGEPVASSERRRQGWVLAGTIHSHGNMTAFHSSVDEDDEEHVNGIHITIGMLDGIPEYACDIVSQGTRMSYEDIRDLISGIPEPEKFPDTWMNAVKVEAPNPEPLVPSEDLIKAWEEIGTDLEDTPKPSLIYDDEKRQIYVEEASKPPSNEVSGSFAFSRHKRWGSRTL